MERATPDQPAGDALRQLAVSWGEAAVLQQLFARGAVVDPTDLDAVAPELAAALLDHGLVGATSAGLRAHVRLSPWEGLLIAHDRLVDGPLPSDVVLHPSPTTRTMQRLMVRRPCRRALDVGTGCGALALSAARFADHVVATDVNPRALWLTQINARINGLTNVHTVAGSLLEPVRDESFDLIVGNLPFVLSPGTPYLFRDGDRQRGSDICASAVSGAARVLAPGGIAQFLVNWAVSDEDAPVDRPVGWVRSTGCSGLVLFHSSQQPRDYASKWSHDAGDDVEQWVEHLHALGAAAVANGAVVLHRQDPHASRRIRSARISTSLAGDGGQQVERILCGPAGTVTDDQLLAATPRLVTPSTVLTRSRRTGTETVRRAEVRLDDTCGVVGVIDDSPDFAAVVEIVERLDGSVTLTDAIDEIYATRATHAADRSGLGDDERSTPDDLVAAVVRSVRRLVLAGVVTFEA